MDNDNSGQRLGRALLISIIISLALIAVMAAVIAKVDSCNDVHAFSEPVVQLTDGWTLTDSAGTTADISLPYKLYYGRDGVYTLQTALPKYSELISSPALQFYSSYTDVKIYLGGKLMLSYPNSAPTFSPGTGNTWQYVRLPSDYGGKTLKLEIRCQLGDSIEYNIKPLLLGAKGTMLSHALSDSALSLAVSVFMSILGILLAAMYFLLRRKLALNRSTVYLALFAAVFAAYVYCESALARMLFANGHMLYFCTLALLALMPLPLVGFFSCGLSKKYRYATLFVSLLCVTNLFVQIMLHFMGVINIRLMIPATYWVIVVSALVMILCMLLADRENLPGVHVTLLTSLPMLLGGCADIILQSLGRPSFNNSLWFTLGVTMFLLLQFFVFLSSYFALYRSAIQAGMLREMAFVDSLTDIGNRNAYEQRLKELGAAETPEGLCCIVADINNLKYINDTYGHLAGDRAIRLTGAVLDSLLPAGGTAFRTGGDEFVLLIDDMAEQDAAALAAEIARKAAQSGSELSIPLVIAVGSGRYDRSDGNIQDFIRRIDTRMYQNKRSLKDAEV